VLSARESIGVDSLLKKELTAFLISLSKYGEEGGLAKLTVDAARRSLLISVTSLSLLTEGEATSEITTRGASFERFSSLFVSMLLLFSTMLSLTAL